MLEVRLIRGNERDGFIKLMETYTRSFHHDVYNFYPPQFSSLYPIYLNVNRVFSPQKKKKKKKLIQLLQYQKDTDPSAHPLFSNTY